MTAVAYLIIAHNLPDQALRLARALVNGSRDSQVFIHYDAKAGAMPTSALPRLTLLPERISVEWGDWSQVEVVLRAIQYIQAHMAFDWLVVLSGQDFPIKPVRDFERFLADGDFDAYVEARPMRECARPGHTMSRYYYRYWKLPKLRYAYRIPKGLRHAFDRFLSSLPEGRGWFNYLWLPRGLPARFGVRRWRVPFGPDFECYQGSDWFNLSRKAVTYLLDFLEQRPDVLRYYQGSCIPSEGLFQTILFNSGGSLRCQNRQLREIFWEDEHAASPQTIRSDKIPLLDASPEFFARKFDTRVDAAVIDYYEARTAQAPSGNA